MITENFYGKSQPCEPTSIVKTEDSVAKKRKQLEGRGQIIMGNWLNIMEYSRLGSSAQRLSNDYL